MESGLGVMRDAIAADRFKDSDRTGAVTEKSVTKDWVAHALGFVEVDKLQPCHIGFDAGNGMGGLVVSHLSGRWPLIVEPINFELNGAFPNHPANPPHSRQ